MKECCVCGREIVAADPYVLFRAPSGKDMYGCENCEKQMNTLMKAENPSELKEAINYFYIYAADAEDETVRRFLMEVVENNAIVVKEICDKDEKKKPIEARKRDYFADQKAAVKTSSGWITLMRVLAILYTALTLISNLFLTIPAIRDGQIGIAAALLGIAATGFLLLSFTMVITNMANDVKFIRKKLEDDD